MVAEYGRSFSLPAKRSTELGNRDDVDDTDRKGSIVCKWLEVLGQRKEQ